MAPLTSVSCPFAAVSFVAALPPVSVSCVSDGSSVNAIDEPGGADAESVKTRCATRLPGALAFKVNGMGLVVSLKVSSSDTEPAPAGANSEVGVRPAVIPARLNVTDETADAGA